ncbi:hypothetical protein AJ80_03892 [Polytolypa hystricis UAMH7299]|uniref:AA1-like domain-containing protein n=1 Tax=Polytolypa hystricis (strain UAMH7299) TaxID=1447883 RepID=A0A2B7YDF2_POLH7|nr:hypothetical protein AJ80_03892 [Polytolypa hystricis UAMH7299]
MRFSMPVSLAAAILAIAPALPFGNALPTSENNGENNAMTTIAKRQVIPNNINIGINKKRHNAKGYGMWTAWVNGADPCHHHADLLVYENEESPCNIRFSLDGQDFQYTMQGCGGDLWLMRLGKDYVGTCDWAPGEFGCVAGDGYSGRWQCHVNDGPG